MNSVNGKTSFFRYRTGGEGKYTAILTLAAASSVSQVEMMVNSPSSNGVSQAGFSGIQILANDAQVFNSNAMYGDFGRSGKTTYTDKSPFKGWGEWNVFKFDRTATGVNTLKLVFHAADQDGDNCVSFNSIKIGGF